jgi:hypothetical protein
LVLDGGKRAQLKGLADVPFVAFGARLDVVNGPNLAANSERLLRADRVAAGAGHGKRSDRVIAEVDGSAAEYDWRGRAVAADLRDPLGPHVVQGGRVRDVEAEQEDVSLLVADGPDRVVRR